MANRQKSTAKGKVSAKGGSSKPQRRSAAKGDSNARDQLLTAAKKLFAQKGLSGTSIRDVAQKAKLNSSLISYYFNGKVGLYKECLREIGETRLQFAQQILREVNTPEELRTHLRLFAENLFSLYLEDKDAGLIVVREYDRVNSPAEAVFKETFLKIFELLIEFFENAQSKKLIPASRDPFVLAGLFFGSLASQMRLDHIKDKVYDRGLRHPAEQKKLLNHILDIFLSPRLEVQG